MNPITETLPKLAPDIALELTLLTGEVFQTATTEHDNLLIVGQTCAIQASTRTWPKPRFLFEPAAIPPRRTCLKTSDMLITCDTNRTAASIARDIRSRLLGNARTWTDSNASYDDERQRTEAVKAKAIQTLLDAGYKPANWNDSYYGEHITARYFLDGDFTLELRYVPAETAVQIYNIMQALERKG